MSKQLKPTAADFSDPEVRQRVFVPTWSIGRNHHNGLSGKAVMVWYDPVQDSWVGRHEHKEEIEHWAPYCLPYCTEETPNYCIVRPRSYCAECNTPMYIIDYLCEECRG
jgi:hypothetical protein